MLLILLAVVLDWLVGFEGMKHTGGMVPLLVSPMPTVMVLKSPSSHVDLHYPKLLLLLISSSQHLRRPAKNRYNNLRLSRQHLQEFKALDRVLN